MKLVKFTQNSTNKMLYLNPEHVVSVSDYGGKARVTTLGAKGDWGYSYILTCDCDDAVADLQGA